MDTKNKGHNIRQIAKNFAYLFSGNVIGKGSTFLVLILLARWLDESDFGRISYVLAIIQFFIIGFDGFDLIGVRETAVKSEKVSFIVSNISVIRFLYALIAYILIVAIFSFVESDPVTKWLFIIFGIKILCVGLFLGWFYQGIERMNYTALGIVIAEGGFLILIVGLFKPGFSSLTTVGWFQILPYVLSVFLLWLVFKTKYYFSVDLINFEWSWKKAKAALLLSLSAIVLLMAYNWGFIVLRFLDNYEKIGIYSASHNILRAGLLGIHMMFFAILPYFSRTAKEGKKESLKSACEVMFKYISISLIPIIILGCYYSKTILNLIYGGKYSGTWPVFSILFPTVLLVALNLVHNRILIVYNDQGRLAKAHILIGVVGAVLSTLLIPFMGIYGNAFAILGAELFALLYMSKLARQHIDIKFYKNILMPLLGGLILLIAVWGLNNVQPIIALIVGLQLYVIIIYLTRNLKLSFT